MAEPLVLILLGSDSDLPLMQPAVETFNSFGVPCELRISSAHRSPERTVRFAREAEGRGVRLIIAGAGMSAHLAGVVAAVSALPVIGVPFSGSPLGGLDALLSTVQMPGGVPVMCAGLDRAGAKNAALFAVRMLATGDPALRQRLHAWIDTQAEAVAEKDRRLHENRPA